MTVCNVCRGDEGRDSSDLSVSVVVYGVPLSKASYSYLYGHTLELGKERGGAAFSCNSHLGGWAKFKVANREANCRYMRNSE